MVLFISYFVKKGTSEVLALAGYFLNKRGQRPFFREKGEGGLGKGKEGSREVFLENEKAPFFSAEKRRAPPFLSFNPLFGLSFFGLEGLLLSPRRCRIKLVCGFHAPEAGAPRTFLVCSLYKNVALKLLSKMAKRRQQSQFFMGTGTGAFVCLFGREASCAVGYMLVYGAHASEEKGAI